MHTSAEKEKYEKIELKKHNEPVYKEMCHVLRIKRRCAYISATGTGKSYVVGKFIEENEFEGKALILVPSNVVRDNWRKVVGEEVDILTYQGLLLRKEKYDISRVKVLVCDEMHHLGAEEWGRVYKELIESFDGYIIGLTATPIRFLDNARDMSMEFFEGDRVIGPDLPSAISQGILPGFDYTTALYDVPEKFRKKYRNAFTENLFLSLDVMISRRSFQNILTEKLHGRQFKAAVFVNSISAIDEIEEMCSAPSEGYSI